MSLIISASTLFRAASLYNPRQMSERHFLSKSGHKKIPGPRDPQKAQQMRVDKLKRGRSHFRQVYLMVFGMVGVSFGVSFVACYVSPSFRTFFRAKHPKLSEHFDSVLGEPPKVVVTQDPKEIVKHSKDFHDRERNKRV